jgi:hypothetical protein
MMLLVPRLPQHLRFKQHLLLNHCGVIRGQMRQPGALELAGGYLLQKLLDGWNISIKAIYMLRLHF